MMPSLVNLAVLSFSGPALHVSRTPALRMSAVTTDTPAGGSVVPTAATADPMDAAVVARRKKLASKFAFNEGFYNTPSPNMMSADFVWFGPIVGPLCKADFLGTLAVFSVYDAVSESKTSISEFTQDPQDPNRFWATRYFSAKHTAPLGTGAQTLPATGKQICVGPETVSVTFDDSDLVEKFTGGYISDARDNPSGPFGAAFALLKCIGGPVPPLWLAKILNWVGAKMRNFPKARSHIDDLPAKWAALGRKHGLRAADAWNGDVADKAFSFAFE